MQTRIAAGLMILLGLSAHSGVAAQDQKGSTVPGGEIFGFTSPTDVGEVGDRGFASENDGHIAKRQGSYFDYNSKSEFGYTFAKDWWIAGSFFAGWDRIRGVEGFQDVNNGGFDGLSFELQNVVVKRSDANPFAVAVAVEPRWARFDPVSSLNSNALNASFKFLVDAVVVPNRLFWAMNAYWVPQVAQNPLARRFWLSTSTSWFSSAITLEVRKDFFIGAEVRHLAMYDTATLGERLGYAVYVGPTMAWRLTDKIVFNATWQPQVAGRSSAHPNFRYDLDNFERAQFRAKVSIKLN